MMATFIDTTSTFLQPHCGHPFVERYFRGRSGEEWGGEGRSGEKRGREREGERGGENQ